ncbi:serine/threonine protein kinase CHK1 [Lachancea thermotolerans CBS 6340]|uniref:non-specific serine/threonine protein kinase n=1 Tax=Lachancea thermotolerans (strain ATCC 56472 / CBS 6340 / NRRL Y-8284) TaxID=559295 RepID=C5E346_LACTC|nr:KLTH0H10318p [Lachancea thermotolerans CBS 6340]CAR30457.1 KLTH0H10318p [Lachancea thermotolerans CBS 6340]
MSINFSQRSPLPKIKNLVLGETVGQGSFAFVKAACLESNPETVVAVKFVHLPTCVKHGLSEKDAIQEVVIQSKCSDHLNILKVIDCNVTKNFLWIAMEMAGGGDLFDKIEPDVGVDAEVAQFYFKQLISAVTYLHEKCGIAHRDIKPENILLDSDGNLKLADFGLASQFRRKDGTKRLSSDTRGSLPYMAPEILHSRNYHADLTDIWSCGVLVFVLLTGETPWEQPSRDDDQFREFSENCGNMVSGPWNKISLTQLNLVRKMLQPDPRKRVTLSELRTHVWYTSLVSFSDEGGRCNDPQLLSQKLLSKLHVSLSDDAYTQFMKDDFCLKIPTHTSTQPIQSEIADLRHDSFCASGRLATQHEFFGQPGSRQASNPDTEWTQQVHVDMATQQFQVNSIPEGAFISTSVLTKFYSHREMSSILPMLEYALRNFSIPVKTGSYETFLELRDSHKLEDVFPVTIQIKTMDRKGWFLSGNVSLSNAYGGLVLISFNRRSGDPLEWRRLFKKVSLVCRELVYVP